MSLNEGTDTLQSDEFYKPTVLPTVADLCEMAEVLRVKYPGSNIHEATIDVASAYQQFPLAIETAKLRASIINIYDGRVLVVYLVGVFGDTRASHVYNVIGRAVDYHHNLDLEVLRSRTYIDDTILMDAEEKLDEMIQWENVVSLSNRLSDKQVSKMRNARPTVLTCKQ